VDHFIGDVLAELTALGLRDSSIVICASDHVCVPVRTVILMGHSIESNHPLDNRDEKRTDAPPFPSFDQTLLRNGYRGEYPGKYTDHQLTPTANP